MAVRARRRGRAAVDDGRSADGRSTDGHENAPIPPASGDAVQAWVDGGDGDPASVEVQHELDAPPWRRFESTLMATSRQIRRAYDGRLEKVDLNLSEACLLAYVVEHGPP